MHIGIDPGLKGGIVALPDVPGTAPIAMIAMPTYERKRMAKGKNPAKMENELDTPAFVRFLAEIQCKNDGSTIFHVEQCPRHAASANAMRVMAFTAGKIIGILETAYYNAPIKRLRCGNDNDGWQKKLFQDLKPNDDTKALALKMASELWPEEKWLATEKSKVPHDGLIDAALIAYYGRTKWMSRFNAGIGFPPK